VNHFGFGAPALVAPWMVIVLPVTPPTAMPPRLASTFAGGGADFEGGTK
jgi:hypothetical protein